MCIRDRSAAIGFAASLAGLLLSYAQGWPTGPAIILCAGLAYALSLGAGRAGGMARGRLPK